MKVSSYIFIKLWNYFRGIKFRGFWMTQIITALERKEDETRKILHPLGESLIF